MFLENLYKNAKLKVVSDPVTKDNQEEKTIFIDPRQGQKAFQKSKKARTSKVKVVMKSYKS